jgi:hypothetical protein
MVNAGERSFNETAEESEGALMAKSEGKESFERDYLPPLWPVLGNTGLEGFKGIGLPFRELESESTEAIAARASGYIQELAARVKQHCSAEKLTDKTQCIQLFFVVSDGVRVLHQLAKAFPNQFRRIAEVMPGFPCMFPAHPDELKLLKEEMLNKFNLGKRNTFKLRAAPGRKTFSFETWVNKLLTHYISKIHSTVLYSMVKDVRINDQTALTERAMGARMARIRKAMMPAPLTPENAKVWLDFIWTLLLVDIPEPEKHPHLRKLGQHPSRTERAHFGERKTRRSIKDAVGENAKHQTAGYVRTAIKEGLGKYLVRMLRKEQSDK